MSHGGEGHIGASGPRVRRRKAASRRVSPAPLPAVRKREVKPIGSRAHLYYDPITGRKLNREERKR